MDVSSHVTYPAGRRVFVEEPKAMDAGSGTKTGK